MSTFSSLGKYFLPGALQTDANHLQFPFLTLGGKDYLPGKLYTDDVTVICFWLVRLRWAAAGGFLLLAFCLSLLFPQMLLVRPMYMVCLAIFFYNALFYFLLQRKDVTPQTVLFSIRLQVFLDWLALLLFIHFTGGIFSPLVFFFILHIIIDSMIFPASHCYLYTALSLAGLGVLYFAEDVLRLFPIPNLWLGKTLPPLDVPTMVIAFSLFAFVLFAATFLATSMMVRFRERENIVRLLSQNLQKALNRMETLFEATKVMVSSYDLNTVLNLLVADSVRLLGAKGGAIRVLREMGDEMTSVATHGLSDAFLKKGPIKRDDGLTPKSTEEVIIVQNAQCDPRVAYPKAAQEEGICSIISVPLVSKGNIKGDLRLYAKTEHHFTQEEIAFLKILASGAAVIIDNAQAWKALEESNKKIISFAYKIGHDLKAPVVAIQGLLSAMQEGYAGDVPPKQKDILARCIKKQEHLLLLIKDVLNLAEEQIPTESQKVVSVFIDAIASETIRLLEAQRRQKGITIIFTPQPNPIPFQEVPGDLQRLFSNLLDNALRYTPAGGTVELELSNDDEKISIMVRDSGIGIEPEHKEKIFDEFFRTPQAKRSQTDGTGLGLAIVKGIVQRYHGEIQVESEVGKGTTFYVTLPRR